MSFRQVAISASAMAGVLGAVALNPIANLATALDDDAALTPPPSAAGEATPQPSTPETPAPAPAPDGVATQTYTGEAYESRWGPMQVSATIGGGQILDITWLSYPTDRKSLQINEYAAPLLVERALEAQSAQVDGITGATSTVAGFQFLLQSALDQAGL